MSSSEVREMREAETVLNIHKDRGFRGLPLERVYKHLFDPTLFLQAYGKIYRNYGAMTRGASTETVDGMSMGKIQTIIDLLKQEKWVWTPARRTYIPKANGKTRPLGIPTWSDKLVQEAMRTLLEPYYEQRFSRNSHGFRPNRGCHTALGEIQKWWKGTTWFIEGDIKGCFDNIDHTILLSILQRDIHDGRLIRLIDNLLRSGYMEDWRYNETLSGTPQGGIISPLLANIYLNELDRFVEDTLIPEYSKGERRRTNPIYHRLVKDISAARKEGKHEECLQLQAELRKHPAGDSFDPNYRRLRYVRYADDFLLGYTGPKADAEAIRQKIGTFLRDNLKLELSLEKTLITHARDEKAIFLGYEIKVSRAQDKLDAKGSRSANGSIALLMPRKAVMQLRAKLMRDGKVSHRPDMVNDSVHTLVNRYQSILRGMYNYYCMATNVGHDARMSRVKWYLEMSLTKTLACKLKCKVTDIYREHRIRMPDTPYLLRFETPRPDKEPLVAVFGGISFRRQREGNNREFLERSIWFHHAWDRSETVARLLSDKCELCEGPGPLEAHHIRKMSDIRTLGRREKPRWMEIMIARNRKTLMVCKDCHDDIHAGRYNGTALRVSPESRVR